MKNNTDHFRRKLLALKDEATERINAIDKDMRHEGMSADWSEQATERENDEVLESLGSASEKELMMIDFALKRLDSGEYFLCQNCGTAIPEARLELLPFSAVCVKCAEELDS